MSDMATPQDRIPDKRAETVALAGSAMALLGLLLMLIVSNTSNSFAALLEGFHLLVGALIWFVSWLHLRTLRLAREESMAIEEAERLRSEQGRERLFGQDGEASGLAQQRLREMNRYGVSIAALLAVLLQAAIGIFAVQTLLAEIGPTESGVFIDPLNAELSNAMIGGGVAFGVCFFHLLLGTYAAGMSRIASFRVLRAGAGYALGISIVSFLLTLSFAASYFGWLKGDIILGWIVAALLIVFAVEMLINLVLEYYRPRTPGETPKPVYGSRITSLLAEPRGLFHTFAHTLDYQFGFKVSDTWFFHFLHRAIMPLVLFQLLTLYLLTCFAEVEEGTVAVLERWGRPVGVSALPARPLPGQDAAERARLEAAWDEFSAPIEPGLVIKYPWPIDILRKVPRDRVQEVMLGAPQETYEATGGEISSMDVVSWDSEHLAGEFHYLMPQTQAVRELDGGPGGNAADVMFISGSIAVQYRVGDSGAQGRPGDVYRYLYRYENPKAVMVSISENEVTKYFAGADFWDVLVRDIPRVRRELRERIQDAVDEAGLGIEIVYIGLSNIHPPAGEVGGAYHAVVSASEAREARIHEGRATAINRTATVPGEVASIENAARSYYAQRSQVSKATAERFRQQMTAYDAAPESYRHREKMRAIDEALNERNRIIVADDSVTIFMDDRQDFTMGAAQRALAKEAETVD